MSSWLLFRTGPCDPAFNMALDEALLQEAARVGKPTLRFYGWTDRAASFGYFQRFADVERATLLRPLVRRPTGGGIVPHDSDWTYSIAFPPNDSWYSLKAIESYRRVHEWIRAAFARTDLATELAPCCRKSEPGQCFVGHEKLDVLWNGKKIAGAAQRRNRNGLLIQGSVQPPLMSAPRTDWEKAMCAVAEEEFGVQWFPSSPGEELKNRAADLAAKKYSQVKYNQKR